jgi:transcriptional regulator with XRE-family HTH domain
VDDIQRSIGERVRNFRKERGLSQEALGWKSDLHFTYIGGIERGEKNCSIKTLQKIAKGLDIDIIELFRFPDHKKDVNQLKKQVKKKIDEASPKTLNLITELMKVLEENC